MGILVKYRISALFLIALFMILYQKSYYFNFEVLPGFHFKKIFYKALEKQKYIFGVLFNGMY